MTDANVTTLHKGEHPCEACESVHVPGTERSACVCPIVQTPGILSGQWRLRGTRIFAWTLLSLGAEYFAKNYPPVEPEQVDAACTWLQQHADLVIDERMEGDIRAGLYEALLPYADFYRAAGHGSGAFETTVSDAALVVAREAFAFSKQAEEES